MTKSETLFWILIGAQTVLAIYLGLSKLRLVFACLLAFAAMLVPMIYDIQVWGYPEGGGLIQMLIGGFGSEFGVSSRSFARRASAARLIVRVFCRHWPSRLKPA